MALHGQQANEPEPTEPQAGAANGGVRPIVVLGFAPAEPEATSDVGCVLVFVFATPPAGDSNAEEASRQTELKEEPQPTYPPNWWYPGREPHFSGDD